MNALHYSTAKQNLEQTMDQVCNDHNPVIITRNNKPSVVIISLDDYQSLAETNYLLKSPNNAKRLLDSISELESGKGIKKELIE